MSLLPVHRTSSQSSTLRPDAPGRTDRLHPSSTQSTTTDVAGDGTELGDEKSKWSRENDEEQVEPSGSKRDEYQEKGVIEVEHEGQTRKLKVVVEQKTGKELYTPASGGPYTQPRWRHSLPFVKRKYPPPPAPLSLDDAKITPQVTAGIFSQLFFNWVTPIMALGAARPLEPTDLWKMDDARSAKPLAAKLAAAYERRTKLAEDYNAHLADTTTSLPWPQNWMYPLLPHRQKREHDYRTKHGKKHASLAMSLSDTFGWYFWIGGLIKVFGDVSTATTPLVMRALISWSTKYQLARQSHGTMPFPAVGHGVGLAFALLIMLVVGSMTVHHFFVRSMSVGVLGRGAIISSVYSRALRLTQKSRGELPNGKLVNHISTDTSRIDFAAGFFHLIWTSPIQFVVIMIILLVEIGYSALPGIAFLALATPLQFNFMKTLFSIRKKSMVWTDKRAKLLQEILGGMRIVKLMAWEIPFLNRLKAIRGMELKYVRKLMIMRSGMMAFAMSLPLLAAILSFITYSLTAHELQAATIFSVITLFQLMRLPLMLWPMSLSATADALNALGRLEKVFDAEIITETRRIDPSMEDAVRVEHASFTWDAAPVVEDGSLKKLKGRTAAAITGEAQGPKTSKKEKKSKHLKRMLWHKKKGKVDLAQQAQAEVAAGRPGIGEASSFTGGPLGSEPGLKEKDEQESVDRIFNLKDIDLAIPRGSLTAIVGAIGSGKSSLLQGLMGEMRRTDGKVTFSGSTALCAQTPWIQNATVRENIVFGQQWDEERYWAAVRDASLEADLELLEDGDGTEIGEKGINLSGGQKQRVNIARAIYFNADIIALDDPLSALDAGVGKAVFFNAIVGALSGKTRILVTHALHFLPYVDHIILMDEGRVAEQGTYRELKASGKAFARLISEFGAEDEANAAEANEQEAITAATAAKKYDRADLVSKGVGRALMQAEERNSGAMRNGTYWNYLKAGKGQYVFPALILAVSVAQAFTVMTSFWLVYWEERRWPKPNGWYMGIYAALGVGSAISLFLQGFSNALLTYFASVELHRSAITRVMFAPQSFFDTTPLGRIMNRFSKDIDTLDNTLGDAMRMAVSTLGNIIGATVLLAIIEPYFLIAMAIVMVLYAHSAGFYRRSSREFKRIDAVLRSSLYSHFSESLSGIATIRSYGESERFFEDNVKRMDVENRAYYLTIINQRWLGMRLDFFGALLTFSVALIVVLAHTISAANGGLGLSVMVTVQQSFSWLVRQLAEVENDMVGAERVIYYSKDLEQESPHEIKENKPFSDWPKEGKIKMENVRLKYRPELPDVLKGLSLSVGASEKIGIVGRTGAGKSSIMVALFRLAELSSGSISIDDLDISKIGLNDLRSTVSIIPQDPLLFSGTLRSNIDPFHTRTDLELYDTLKRAHLVSSDSSLDGQSQGNRFTLDTVIEEEGGNLSVGERSLVSLARALVRGTKILVLDEATASVDVDTDSKIQETIRTEFKDKTLLCIAHRLRTILSYDRILVMSDGQVAEFDTPMNLYRLGGIFHEMCIKSSLTEDDIRVSGIDSTL
ncbi:hypothetical protein TREMEDRAFT_32323 [Tremella mesenterica DSM 1558]|uniref:uncharacterized protein n=1 Tax=Tremella mesenterica (strain ATCC 24925 / CBS 8224 / DSM 1558 / NBRC 9311 / NRRL Y-6157 / RJB 2259-6 / UBC 559-6) TaxID=578456 RepID=UPI0003F49BC9|nr:uncharacterized protein TREMEDRAFT_32323 [Tremella mesenterica DSM 1558]EIW68338.1 hypothetical protein TREMEDRAFT_32323 [Tremella mesenterica DSM 1558]